MDRKALILVLKLFSLFSLFFFFLLKLTTISQTSSQLGISPEPLRRRFSANSWRQNWIAMQPIRGVKQAEGRPAESQQTHLQKVVCTWSWYK